MNQSVLTHMHTRGRIASSSSEMSCSCLSVLYTFDIFVLSQACSQQDILHSLQYLVRKLWSVLKCDLTANKPMVIQNALLSSSWCSIILALVPTDVSIRWAREQEILEALRPLILIQALYISMGICRAMFPETIA